ncbi:aminoacyl-tRNA hydrolase [Lacimicrobium alkaliphilum]|uniref:Peptidyl-tRNA hydrolase n=1 Tax=Lacimicrobium alkaliphilum TaxID=1526571 RepID=A0ABQ1RA02_9ALTE|nr:peptidyl-tRNA hydrolase [Lacimicrobium alkaliphilum]
MVKLIVGLGNPGPEYENTRHNAGAWYLNALARHFHTSLKAEAKFFGYTARLTIAGQDIRLLYPTTFMNRSGQAVSALANFYRIATDEILVAYDELDLPPGIVKLKTGGSASQNGIRDIVSKLGNDKGFHRLRIGIGHPGHKSQVTGHVLGKARAEEQEKIEAAIDEAVRCTDILIKDGMTKAMNRLHSFKAD